ncbi:hypothetical protein [Microbispora hainanensis]|uniref:RlpA-like protein double-psi beta-barrel domain-containing protein n=1 Tax=Microbispora hainanensis TaxID=568844 RepID=A0A544YDA5_9ACTN|nr:hypothetical protein [Microbispora hainanensis]TQS14532.1 hypothetical protein FLX08_33935 [Microbispora hainanensis]
MRKRARQVIIMAMTGTTLVAGAATAADASVIPQAPSPAPVPPAASAASPDTARPIPGDLAALGAAFNAALRTAYVKARKAASMPSGVATATSFWDAQTASGKPMRYRTIASPYWPLGTRVRITYKKKSAIGVVDDFGPAEWAVAQHDIPAIVDLSERMMADLTGVASNTVHVRFQVLKWGKGGVYRRSGTGYKLAMGRR